MKCGVIVFPGSNCDRDCFHILSDVMKFETEWVWHKETAALNRFDVIVLPGGFSYGDYLRAGAIARFSPVMKSVANFASDGGKVLGICNGFQILTEAGLLPGALLQNGQQKFICKNVSVKIENSNTPFTRDVAEGAVLEIPIAHHQGRYYASPAELTQMEQNGQVVLRYCNAEGIADDSTNPNGSANNIAGVSNRTGNVLGMMPHPERCADPQLQGNISGQKIFSSLISSLQ
ncbi:MAG: phosphoribosylformylglycinamidine synthase I [Nitrospinae bacterium CG11_big_fil_rev_8_21_14_0_20_45_15]|nr:MAG: phosphoribosylformylglycinamidine synthase I [Nitrospinae bacterium CG11_big_fil_rev_8_21_14_0_20_45_15]